MQGRYHGEFSGGAYRYMGDYWPRGFGGQRLSRRSRIKGQAEEVYFRRSGDALNDGATFGDGGKGFIRLNYGCARSTLERGLQQMKAALDGLAVVA